MGPHETGQSSLDPQSHCDEQLNPSSVLHEVSAEEDGDWRLLPWQHPVWVTFPVSSASRRHKCFYVEANRRRWDCIYSQMINDSLFMIRLRATDL